MRGVVVRDDLGTLLKVLPTDIMEPLINHKLRDDLLEVVMDLGRKPEARFQGSHTEVIVDRLITREDLTGAEAKLGEFGGDNRAGIEGTLHRISAIRNRKGVIVGLTCRVGRAVTGHVDMIRDILEVPVSLLFLGRPGVGKTTVIRELARTMADDFGKRVVIIDTSNEIGGDGDIPHPAIGGARRMQVINPNAQHHVMIEAVENHMPEVIIVDEIGTEAEAMACRTIAERGVQLIGTAHGQVLENLIKNPTLADLVGGIHSVTLGDDEARARNSQKTVLERAAPPTFPIVLEMRDRSLWVTHWVEDSVDALLRHDTPFVQVRRRNPETNEVNTEQQLYNPGDLSHLYSGASASSDWSSPTASQDELLSTPAALGGQYSSAFDDNAVFSSADDDEAFDVNNPYAWAQRLQDLDDSDALSALTRSQTIGASFGGSGKGRGGRKSAAKARSARRR